MRREISTILDNSLVTCPCCHGKGRLTLVEHDDVAGRTVVTHPMCCHCQGEGVVPAEGR